MLRNLIDICLDCGYVEELKQIYTHINNCEEVAIAQPDMLKKYAPDHIISVLWKLLSRTYGFQKHDEERKLVYYILDRNFSEIKIILADCFIAHSIHHI